MLVLHAAWHDSSLALWAETPARKGRPARGAHPFAAPSPEVAGALGLATKAKAAQVTLNLPSVGGRPLPSPALHPGVHPTTTLTPFRVPAVALAPEAALSLLAPLARESRAPGGAVLGPDLQWWCGAAAAVLSLLARGRAFPDLRERRATWRPLAGDPADAALLALLADGMPPAARAAGGEAREILDEFLSLATRGWIPAPARPPAGWPAPARAWLSRLGTGSALTGREASLAVLETEVRAWVAAAGLDSPWRASFRLEPPADSTAWRVDLGLQSTHDPSLQVQASQVWQERLRLPGEPRPQERLLRELGRVRHVFPEVERALAIPRPASVDLDPTEAAAFLRARAPLLQELGCTVRLPADLAPGTARLVLRATTRGPKTRSSGAGVGLDDLLAFRWTLAMDGEELSYRELVALARLKQPLVQFRGRWVVLDPERLEQAMEILEEGATATLGRLLRTAGGVEPSPVAGVPVEITFEGALAALREGASPAPVAVPEGLRATLRPYQVRGYSWLAFLRDRGLGACLADDMGLGKTMQTLALLLREGRGPSLLVCPTSVMGNWAREVERFAPTLRLRVHHGADRPLGTGFSAEGLDLVVTSYSLLRRDEETLAGVAWRGLILDEAQNVKNPDAGQSRAARRLKAEWRLALTGTPVENHLTDLWSLMEFLNPGLLGPRQAFVRDFAVPVQRYGDTSRLAPLRRMVGPFLLRRMKSDPAIVPDLPEKVEIKTFCPLTREQATLYQATLQEGMREVEGRSGVERRGLVLALLLRLKQICNHPALLLADGSPLSGRSGKLRRLEEMLEEVLEEGDRALVFTQFAEFGQRLARHLQERFSCPVPCLHGGVKREERDAMVADFQAEGGPPLFVLSLKAGGVGLNLTRASRVFHFDRWWNPAVENQATDRAYRIGQTRGVQVYKFLCAGTMEEAIDGMIESKTALAESIVGAGEGWLTELSDARLRELLALREEGEDE